MDKINCNDIRGSNGFLDAPAVHCAISVVIVLKCYEFLCHHLDSCK